MSHHRPTATESDRRTSTGRRPLDRETAAGHAARLNVLADPARVQILSLFTQQPEPLNAQEIAAVLGIGGPAVHDHLNALVRADLVVIGRRGTGTYYRVNDAYAHWLLAIGEALPKQPVPLSRSRVSGLGWAAGVQVVLELGE